MLACPSITNGGGLVMDGHALVQTYIKAVAICQVSHCMQVTVWVYEGGLQRLHQVRGHTVGGL